MGQTYKQLQTPKLPSTAATSDCTKRQQPHYLQYSQIRKTVRTCETLKSIGNIFFPFEIASFKPHPFTMSSFYCNTARHSSRVAPRAMRIHYFSAAPKRAMAIGPSIRSGQPLSHPFTILDQFADFPSHEFTQPHEFWKETNSMFDSLMAPPFTLAKTDFLQMDFVENEGEYIANFDVPGLEKEEVEVTVEKNVLKVSIKHTREEAREEIPSNLVQAEHAPATDGEGKSNPEATSTDVSDDSKPKMNLDAVAKPELAAAENVKVESKSLQTKVHWRERKLHSYGQTSRSFALPKTADLEQIKATQQNGVLKITIPKRELPPIDAPRQIQIE